MKMQYKLKTINPYFEDVLLGRKDFEIRLADKPYKKGDELLLQEYVEGKPTVRMCVRTIKYVLPISSFLTVQQCDFWSIEEINKYGIVILGIE